VPHFERTPTAPGGAPIEPTTISAAVAPPALTANMMGLMDLMARETTVGG